MLSVLGTESGPLFEEGHALLHFWFPQVEDCTIEGVAHLLHMQRPAPVAQGVAEFFAHHPINRQLNQERREAAFAAAREGAPWT